MTIVKLSLDFTFGPIWATRYDPQTRRLICDVPIVDNDEIAQKLNEEIKTMNVSYYEFDSHNQPWWFNVERKIEEAPKMLELMKQLKARLDEINDGSYEVEDYISGSLRRLIWENRKDK